MTDSQAFFGFNEFHSTDQIFSWMFLSWICLLFSTLDWGYVFLKENHRNKVSFSSYQGFPSGTEAKNQTAIAETQRDAGLIPGSGRSSGWGNGGPLQCSCLENPMDRGAWWVTVHGVAKCHRGLSHWVCVSACICAHTRTLISRVHTINMTHHGWCWLWSPDWDCAGVILIFIAYVHSLSDSNLPIEGSALQ